MDRIYAAADIGSNTAHLLVARTNGRTVQGIENINEWIPLGELVAKYGTIRDDVAETLATTVREFRKRSVESGATGLYIFATEAMRSAENHKKVINRIKSVAGVQVEIISPKREAELSLRGVELDTNPRTVEVLFEVGGGSAQIGQISGGSLLKSESLRIGTGTLIAAAALRFPCPDAALIEAQDYVEGKLNKAPFKPSGSSAVASGGVARGLWRALHPDGDRVLRLQELEYLIWSCSHLSVEQIVQRFNVKPKRAGTLLPGALAYLSMMRWSGIEAVNVSAYGIREGAILEMASGRIEPCPV